MLVGGADWFLLRSPAVLGLAPDGAPADSAAPVAGAHGPASATDCTVREAARTPGFAWLYVSSALICLPIFIVFAHIVPYARDAGLDPATASRALSAVGTGSAIGWLVLGPLADRFGRRRSYARPMALATFLVLRLGDPARFKARRAAARRLELAIAGGPAASPLSPDG